MKIKQYFNERQYYYDIYTKKITGKIVKIDSLNQNELDVFMYDKKNINKYPNLIVVRNDNNVVEYDSVNNEFIISKKHKGFKKNEI